MKINYTELFLFTVLFVILFASAILFSKIGDSFYRFLIIVADAVIYVFWGVWHHYSTDRFSKLILLEYALVAILIVILAALGLGVVRFL